MASGTCASAHGSSPASTPASTLASLPPRPGTRHVEPGLAEKPVRPTQADASGTAFARHSSSRSAPIGTMAIESASRSLRRRSFMLGSGSVITTGGWVERTLSARPPELEYRSSIRGIRQANGMTDEERMLIEKLQSLKIEHRDLGRRHRTDGAWAVRRSAPASPSEEAQAAAQGLHRIDSRAG